ncbi:HAD family hydrolase [uncultured Enorma sp.]|uniref:HAD family hydrolase n=1 Tax=uncultured Enorma sp. TaxID=1714346 RepID=UPI0025D750D2|nr:HAD hydrolase family protein [uncultured Enorma sp.]
MGEARSILFFDVDGTIIWHKPGGDVAETVANARPSEAVTQAFHELRKRGHLAFICTGRPLALIAESLLALESLLYSCSSSTMRPSSLPTRCACWGARSRVAFRCCWKRQPET